MKVLAIVVISSVLAVSPAVSASPKSSERSTVADEFSAGVLGFVWGSKLTDVLRYFPPGIAWPLSSPNADVPADRFFAVPDDTPVLGVKRPNQHTLFGFDQSQRLVVSIFSMPYSAKTELMKRARTQFGPATQSRVKGAQQRSLWGPVNNIGMLIVEIPDENYPSLFVMVFRTQSKPSGDS
jgi:hypothetical protein